jgi:hypothetical protein
MSCPNNQSQCCLAEQPDAGQPGGQLDAGPPSGGQIDGG